VSDPYQLRTARLVSLDEALDLHVHFWFMTQAEGPGSIRHMSSVAHVVLVIGSTDGKLEGNRPITTAETAIQFVHGDDGK
jgi:hypothetical protein